MTQVVNVFDESCEIDAVHEAVLLNGRADHFISTGRPPLWMPDGPRSGHVSASTLRAGRDRTIGPLIDGGAAMVCWSVDAAVSVSWGLDGVATPLAVRLIRPPGRDELRKLFSLARTDWTAVVCATAAIAGVVESADIPAEVRVIPPMAYPPEGDGRQRLRQSLRRRLGIAAEGLVIAAPGTAGRESGHKHAVWATGILRFGELPAEMVMPDTGPLARQTGRFAACGGFAERVHLVEPSLPPAALLAAADVALFGQAGCLGRVPAATAMSMRVPVIAVEADGHPDGLIDGDNALLAPPGKPRAIARALTRFAEDKALADRVTASARSFAERRFAPAATRAAWDDLRRDLARRVRPSPRPRRTRAGAPA